MTPKQTERDLQFVADIAQRVEDDALLPEGAGEDVVNLIEQQDLDVHGAHKANCDLLEFNHRRPRVLRHAQRRQDLGVKAPLARLAGELQGEDTRALDAGLAVEERRVLGAKALHDHGLAHAAVAVDRDAWHAGGARMLQQQATPWPGAIRPAAVRRARRTNTKLEGRCEIRRGSRTGDHRPVTVGNRFHDATPRHAARNAA